MSLEKIGKENKVDELFEDSNDDEQSGDPAWDSLKLSEERHYWMKYSKMMIGMMVAHTMGGSANPCLMKLNKLAHPQNNQEVLRCMA